MPFELPQRDKELKEFEGEVAMRISYDSEVDALYIRLLAQLPHF